MKKTLYIFLILTLLLVGCGNSDAMSDTDKSNTDQNEEGDEKLLVVGTTNASPPNAFVDSETDEVQGIMVDLIKEVAEKMDYNVEFDPMPFSSLIPSLEKKRVDVISAGMAYNEERARVVSFTDTVYGFQEALVVPAGNPNKIKVLEDLEGRKVGVQDGTVYHDYLEESGIPIEIVVYENTNQMLIDVTQERIDAMISDTPLINYLIQQNPSFDVELVEDYEPAFSLEMGFITRHEDEELRTQLNEAIKMIKEDGTLDKIHEKWGVKRQDYY